MQLYFSQFPGWKAWVTLYVNWAALNDETEAITAIVEMRILL